MGACLSSNFFTKFQAFPVFQKSSSTIILAVQASNFCFAHIQSKNKNANSAVFLNEKCDKFKRQKAITALKG